MGRRGLGSVLGLFGAAFAWFFSLDWLAHLEGAIRQSPDMPWWWESLPWRVLQAFLNSSSVFCACAAGGLAMLAVLTARHVAAARLRRGKTDPLERLRSNRWPRISLNAVPWVAFVATMSASISGRSHSVAANVLAAIATGAVGYLVARMNVRTLLEPAEMEGVPKHADEVVFWAVPVTPRTRAVVGGFAAVLAAMAAVIALTGWDSSLYAFVATVFLVPFAFRRASRIAVGIDGVWVRDASQVRFFAYRDLDEARAKGADLELVRGGRTTLHLQMHGEDAAQRGEVIARVNAGIARSRDASARGAEVIVQTVGTTDVTAATNGADRYRLPSILARPALAARGGVHGECIHEDGRGSGAREHPRCGGLRAASRRGHPLRRAAVARSAGRAGRRERRGRGDDARCASPRLGRAARLDEVAHHELRHFARARAHVGRRTRGRAHRGRRVRRPSQAPSPQRPLLS